MKAYLLYVLTEHVHPYALSTDYNKLNLLKEQLKIDLEVADDDIWIEEISITDQVTQIDG